MNRSDQRVDSDPTTAEKTTKETKSENSPVKDDDEDKKVPFSNLVRIIAYSTTRDRLVLLTALLAAIASGVALPLSNIILGKLIGNFNNYFVPGSTTTKKQFKHTVSQNALFFVYLFIAKFVLTYISTFCFRTTGLRISAGLRLGYLTALFAQPISKLDQVSAGTVSNTITSSANSIQVSISDRLALLFNGLALLVTAYIIAFIYSWQLTLTASSTLLFICVVYSLITPTTLKLQQSIDKADAKHASIAGEIFGSIRTVFSLGAETPLSKKYFSWVEESKRRGLRFAPHLGYQLAPIFFSMYASFSLSFWFGLKLYREGHIQGVRDVVTVIFSLMIVVSILGNIVNPIMLIVKAISASTEFFDVMDSECVRREGLQSPDVTAQEDIIMEDVKFSYPTRKDVFVLNGFNARFAKGKTTALVGPSGSGKSTIVGLLERWYSLDPDSQVDATGKRNSKESEHLHSNDETGVSVDPEKLTNSGVIRCGQHNIDSLDLKWWRTQIGFVQQEPFLFNDTIFKNVSFGLLGTEWEEADDNTKRELVAKACEEAFAHDFIQRLPDKYDTMVGESGIKLSGGQRQRIAIARSIVRQPKILILDEATSSIDVRSERIVQEALDRVSQQRTSIIIAHRLATIRKADHIVVLRNGCNIEEGTHESLLAKEGLYHSLVAAQKLEQTFAPDGEKATGVEIDTLRKTTTIESEPGNQTKDTSEQAYKPRGFFSTVGRFLLEQRRYWPWYTLTLGGIMTAGAAFSLQSFFFARIIQVFQYTGSKLTHDGNFWALMFFVLALAMGASYFTIGLGAGAISTFVGFQYRQSYFLDILRQPVSFFDGENNSSGALMSRLSTDPKNLQELLGMNGAFPTISVFNLTGCIIIAFYFGWKLTLVGVFAAMPVLLATQFLRLRYEVQFDKVNSTVFAESSTFATEAISAMRTVVSLTMEDTIVKRYKTMLDAQIKDSIRKASYNLVVLAFADSVNLLVMSLIFWYGGQLLSTHEYNPVQFFVIYIATVQGSEGAGQFFALAPNLAQATASANRILKIRGQSTALHANPELMKDIPASGSKGGAAVNMEGISFKYPTREGILFRNLSLSISAGQFVAFVGPSGCGKTSIVSLLERFYEPVVGKICLNGVNVHDIDLKTYRKELSLVAQEPKLFDGTIRENLLLGVDQTKVTDERIYQACRDAEIHDFITSLPDGYGTELGIGTSTALSGGQKQRLCLARALLREPKLLLLDEATSSLDSQSEKLVQQAIERLAQNQEMTIIAIAHRLATIQKADVIFVFGEGEDGRGSKILEQGTHQELLGRRGVYCGMCQAQALDQ